MLKTCSCNKWGLSESEKTFNQGQYHSFLFQKGQYLKQHLKETLWNKRINRIRTHWKWLKLIVKQYFITFNNCNEIHFPYIITISLKMHFKCIFISEGHFFYWHFLCDFSWHTSTFSQLLKKIDFWKESKFENTNELQ